MNLWRESCYIWTPHIELISEHFSFKTREKKRRKDEGKRKEGEEGVEIPSLLLGKDQIRCPGGCRGEKRTVFSVSLPVERLMLSGSFLSGYRKGPESCRDGKEMLLIVS